MAYGEENDFGWSNIVVKFLLFGTNMVVWLLGMCLLGVGIYVQLDTTFGELGFDDYLTSPSIVLMVVGSILFLLGFLGCFGALFELLPILIIYVVVLSAMVIAEVAVVAYVYVEEDSAYQQLEDSLAEQIEMYFDDVNRRDVIDLIQSELLECCGIHGPEDWERNIYFACDSPAFQRCSVPYSCCEFDEGDVVNVQCGYRTLDVNATDRYLTGIHLTGCLDSAQDLVQENLYLVLGVGVGLLVFQISSLLLAAGLVIDVYKEKKVISALKQRRK